MSDDSTDLHERLRATPLFAALDGATLAAVAAAMEPSLLDEGETLFSEGDAGDAMYLVLDGALDVRVGHASGTDTLLDRLGPGAIVGEMALLTDHPRTASVVAQGRTALRRLDRTGFGRLTTSHPALLEHAHELMRPRLERTQAADLLRDGFGLDDAAGIQAFLASVTWRTVQRGESLFQPGDRADAAYLIVSGKLASIADGAAAGRELGRGQTVGGAGLLLERPHDHGIVARRDSRLIEIPRNVAAAHPRFLSQLLGDALAATSVRPPQGRAVGSTVVVLPIDPSAPAERLGRLLSNRIAAWGRAALVSARDVETRFGTADAAASRPGDAFDLAVSAWLDEGERSRHQTLYLANPTLDAWTERCLRAADLVLLVATADGSPEPRPLELELAAFPPDVPLELVLVHPDGRERPAGTAAWLERRSLRAHHHVRLDMDDAIARLARRITGRGVALALSGGGARGYVHIGLLQATSELAFPIDMVVGTSMGALVGGIFASFGSHAACIDAAKAFGDPRKVLDYTFPLVALTRSRKVTRFLMETFGDLQIEDLWVPFACVSANLTRSELRVHDRGSLWRAVRASTAIPGIFTPVMMDDDVLTDGGVMNNFPVDIARERLGTGLVVGSDAYGTSERSRSLRFGDDIPGWRVLLERLLPRRLRTIRAPTILGTLMRSNSLSSRALAREVAHHADLVLHYATEHASALEFHRHEELTDLGYEQGRAALTGWDAWREGSAPGDLQATLES